jgi:hypothetical protein
MTNRPKVAIPVTAIWLRRIGGHAEVLVETDDQWYMVIKEPINMSFSHIEEGSGRIYWMKDYLGGTAE